jgi:site-specific recombinase XerD
MDPHALWKTNPTEAYHDWQHRHAVGATRRLFADRSVTQHCAMFERFERYLVEHRTSVLTFDEAHLDSFLSSIKSVSTPGATTAHRYVKLVDRLCRYLVDLRLRKTNPAERKAKHQLWPQDDPDLIYLDEDTDALLQAHLQDTVSSAEPRTLRDRAIVALLLGTGITSSELRFALDAEVSLDPRRPHVLVPKRGTRAERKVTIAEFAVPALDRWKVHVGLAQHDALLFPSTENKPISDWMLIHIVKAALEAIDFKAREMGPRLLRNTYARRKLLQGRSDSDVSALLGLVSLRTVHRIRQTMPEDEDCAATPSSIKPAIDVTTSASHARHQRT